MVRREALWGKRKYPLATRIINLAFINTCKMSTKEEDQEHGKERQTIPVQRAKVGHSFSPGTDFLGRRWTTGKEEIKE